MPDTHETNSHDSELADRLRRLPYPAPPADLADRIVQFATAQPQQKASFRLGAAVDRFFAQLFAPLPAGMAHKSALACALVMVVALGSLAPDLSSGKAGPILSAANGYSIEDDETYLVTALAYDDTLYELEGM